MRTTDIGAEPLIGDESWLAFLAYDFGHNGQRAELGVTSSAQVNQPPFFHDVFAIPFSFDPDPRLARLFMAALQLIGMAVLYFMLRRYWSSRIALAGLLIYAVLPRAVWAGRFIWNPYLAIPFMIGFITLGLLSSEGKPWARIWQLPVLACVIGSHPIYAMTAILLPLFALRDWWQHPTKRRQLLRDYAIGIVLAGLVLLPWGIGVLHQRATTPTQGQLVLKSRSDFGTISQFAAEATSILDFGSFLVPQGPNIQLANWLVTAVTGLGWLILFGALFVLVRAAWQIVRKQQIAQRFPELVLGVAFFSVPVFMVLSPTRTYDQYYIILVPCAAAIIAILLFGNWPQRINQIRWRVLILAVVCLLEMGYVVDALRLVRNLSGFTRDQMPPIQDIIPFRDAAVRPGIETIYLVDNGSTRAFEQELNWLMLDNKGPSRVIWGDNTAIPLPQQGATYVEYADSRLLPEVFQANPTRLELDNVYRVVDVPAQTTFPINCPPAGPTKLANGATILGYYIPKSSTLAPQPKQEWTIYLLWRTTVNSDHTSYQVFNHLVNGQGTKFGQRDLPTLDTDLWHDGDLLVSKVTIGVNDQLPLGQPLYLRVGMYTLANLHNVNVLDDHGTAVGNWVTIPICQRF